MNWICAVRGHQLVRDELSISSNDPRLKNPRGSRCLRCGERFIVAEFVPAALAEPDAQGAK